MTDSAPLRALRAYNAANATEAITAVEEPLRSCDMCWHDFPASEVNEYGECASCYAMLREEYGE